MKMLNIFKNKMKNEIELISKKHKNEIDSINKNHQDEIDLITSKHKNEIKKMQLEYESKLEKSLKSTTKNLKIKILDILCKTNEELYEISEFPVYKNDETNKWYMITSICSLGGCEYRWIEFDTERKALENSVIRSIIGEKVDMSGACRECYSEYMKDCI